jgi:hypothetical protein
VDIGYAAVQLERNQSREACLCGGGGCEGAAVCIKVHEGGEVAASPLAAGWLYILYLCATQKLCGSSMALESGRAPNPPGRCGSGGRRLQNPVAANPHIFGHALIVPSRLRA